MADDDMNDHCSWRSAVMNFIEASKRPRLNPVKLQFYTGWFSDTFAGQMMNGKML